MRETALELREQFQSGAISAEKIVEHTLARIEKREPRITSFLQVFHERARKTAKALDQKRAQGKPLGKLAGVPIAIKDNIHIKGEITTCASRFLKNYKAVFDATVVQLLERADAILIGKTNLDEFAMGSTTENSALQLTKNPWNEAYSPGGSSGGSSACVAARICPLSLGSDTGGSVRLPAAYCGIVGFKPSYGRVSRYGLVAFGSSFDQIGPFSTTVADAALIMEVIAGHCKNDATSIPQPPEPWVHHLHTNIKGKKLGIPWHFCEGIPHESKEVLTQSLSRFKELGVEIVEINLDILKIAVSLYYTLSTAEASMNLARFDGIRYGARSPRAKTLQEVYELSRQEGFGPEVKRRILLGTFVLSSSHIEAFYRKAQKVRTLVIQACNEAFAHCDMIALPTSPSIAPRFASFQNPLQMYLQDIFTVGANLTGFPAISIPSGLSKEGMPYGLQLMGPMLHDAQVLQFAHAYEQHANHSFLPPMVQHE